MIFEHIRGKLHHLREEQAEILIAVLHADNLLKKNERVVIFLPQHKLLAENETVVHEILARKPFCKAKSGVIHAHPLEFGNSIILTVVHQIEENQFGTAFLVIAL